MSNKLRLPERPSWILLPYGWAIGFRPLMTETILKNFRKMFERDPYLTRKFIRLMEACLRQGAPKCPSNRYLAKRLGRSERTVSRDIQRMEHLGLVSLRYVNYPGTVRNGKLIPVDTRRFITPCIDFEPRRRPNRSPTHNESQAFLTQYCKRFKYSDRYLIGGGMVRKAGGGYLIVDVKSGKIIRETKNDDQIFDSNLFPTPDGRMVDFYEWNGV